METCKISNKLYESADGTSMHEEQVGNNESV